MSQAPTLLRFDAVAPLREATARWRGVGERIVLVPTMGALHAGHLALMAEARRIGKRVVASIFVNPIQFGPNEDFSRYPRDIEADIALLEKAGVDAAYLPGIETMYPPGFSTRIEVADLAEGLCGAYRSGHFSGVATVVTKLVNQVRPDIALFGEKDYQQFQVITRALRDLDIAIEIRGVPTLREPDGLALSSRNRYLTTEERDVAPRLQAVLSRIGQDLAAGAEASGLVESGIAELERAGFSPVQYLAVCDAETLAPIERMTRPARVLAAAYLGRTRLIDNVAVVPRP